MIQTFENPVLRQSLSDQIAAQLRQSIVSGALPPGTHLRETEIAGRLQVSRGPVREALRTLQSEGLLESFPNRGVFVARFDERDTRELFELRELLEVHALRALMRNITAAQLAVLDNLVRQAKAAAAEGNLDRVFELELQLHDQLWTMSDNKRLVTMLREILVQIRAFLGIGRELYVEPFEGIADHERLLDAIRSGNVSMAEAELREHLANTQRIVVAHFRKLNTMSVPSDEAGA